MKYTEIADELIANATALNDEVSSLATLFSETAFLGDNRNFPHAHYGYLMACSYRPRASSSSSSTSSFFKG